MTDIQTYATTLPFGASVLDGVLTAGQPEEAHFVALGALGCRTVVDLRGPHEPRPCDEPTCVQANGMEYVSIPITPQTLGDETFADFRSMMRDASKRPLLVHCATSDRVGALLLPYLILDQGHDLDRALELATKAGLRSMQLAQIALDYAERAAT